MPLTETAPRPLVAVTCGAVLRHTGLPYYGLNRQYIAALQDAGADVVVVPDGEGDPAVHFIDRLSGLLLPGGLDIEPWRYGATPHPKLGRVDRSLDALELRMMREAIARRLPVLGICRGQQTVNVALGGTLYQDIRAEGVAKLRHWTPLKWGRDFLGHMVSITPGSAMARAAAGASEVRVNSFHHQAIKDLAPGLRVTAVSPDGVVEAVESVDGRIVAVQSHPECLPEQPWARRLFQDFVAQAAAASYTLSQTA